MIDFIVADGDVHETRKRAQVDTVQLGQKVRDVSDGASRIRECAAVRTTFAARKTVFVNPLRRVIFVLDDRFEIDQFDDEHACYIILIDGARYLAPTRLLATPGTHLGKFGRMPSTILIESEQRVWPRNCSMFGIC